MSIRYAPGVPAQPPQARSGAKKRRAPFLSETRPTISLDPLSFFELHLCSAFLTNMRGETPFMRQRPNLGPPEMEALKRVIGWNRLDPEALTDEEAAFARRCTGPFILAETSVRRELLDALAAKHWIQFQRYTTEPKEQLPPPDLRLPWFCIVPTPKGWKRILEGDLATPGEL